MTGRGRTMTTMACSGQALAAVARPVERQVRRHRCATMRVERAVGHQVPALLSALWRSWGCHLRSVLGRGFLCSPLRLWRPETCLSRERCPQVLWRFRKHRRVIPQARRQGMPPSPQGFEGARLRRRSRSCASRISCEQQWSWLQLLCSLLSLIAFITSLGCVDLSPPASSSSKRPPRFE